MDLLISTMGTAGVKVMSAAWTVERRLRVNSQARR
jgi:hypothetical protein